MLDSVVDHRLQIVRRQLPKLLSNHVGTDWARKDQCKPVLVHLGGYIGPQPRSEERGHRVRQCLVDQVTCASVDDDAVLETLDQD